MNYISVEHGLLHAKSGYMEAEHCKRASLLLGLSFTAGVLGFWLFSDLLYYLD